jgi:pimeloyl-ACP methyl ester carboxylesterase
VNRRTALKAALTAAALAPGLAPDLANAQPRSPQTFVLVHGAWHGGWCWRDVADRLRAAGCRVFTPTQTGLGQSRHLLAGTLTLQTFADDVANLLEMEDLKDVVLVGHSFAGPVISLAADRVRERISRMVYLDSLLIESGQSPFSVLPTDVVEGRRKLAAEQGAGVAIPNPMVSVFGVPEDHPRAAWVRRHLTPHPIGTYESRIRLEHPVGNGLPCTYVHCTSPSYAPLEASRQWARKQAGWAWRDLPTGHDAMVLAPDALAQLLLTGA